MSQDVKEERRQVGGRNLQSTSSQHDGRIPFAAGKALLIVDDEPMLTELLRSMVEGKGYQALTAHSGEEALRLYNTHMGCIAMVITDLNMPGMGGAAMIDELLRRDPEAKLLVASGSCTEDDEEALLQRGVRGVLHKPFPPRQLFLHIQDALAELCRKS